jgi:hypothetical protein
MKRRAAAAGAALILVLGAALPARSAIPGEELFKWGEYDSLIRVLEPAFRAPGSVRTHEDSLRQAKSLLFLGVAFCATGNPERADRAFSDAVELDPQVELDRFYVTEEIANRFQSTALRALRKRTPAAAEPDRFPPKPSASGHPAPVLAPPQGHGWAWLGLGAAAAIAAVTSYYLLADREEPARDDVIPIDLSEQ